MKRSSLVIVAAASSFIFAACFAETTLAADMALKAPPPPVAYNWTGFYLGIEGGGGWAHAEDTDFTGFDSGRFNVTGGLVGGTIGYNWQINRVVLGLEGDGSGVWMRGSTTGTGTLAGTCGGAPPFCESELQALGTVRGRAGIAIDRVLPYVTGGLAIGSLHGHEGDVLADGAVGDGTTTVAGWTVGAGLEGVIASRWTAKIEYLHVDLGNNTIFTDTLPPAGITAGQNVRFTAEILRAGLNYKFDWAPPLVAKY